MEIEGETPQQTHERRQTGGVKRETHKSTRRASSADSVEDAASDAAEEEEEEESKEAAVNEVEEEEDDNGDSDSDSVARAEHADLIRRDELEVQQETKKKLKLFNDAMSQ